MTLRQLFNRTARYGFSTLLIFIWLKQIFSTVVVDEWLQKVWQTDLACKHHRLQS